jgi:hypothetical protein
MGERAPVPFDALGELGVGQQRQRRLEALLGRVPAARRCLDGARARERGERPGACLISDSTPISWKK